MKDDKHSELDQEPDKQVDEGRRQVLAMTGAMAAGAAAVALTDTAEAATDAAREYYADPDNPGLPHVDMEVVPGRTALVVVDPQIDFLSEQGVTWGVVGESVTEQQTVENIEKLFIAAKASDMHVFVSPHYYYPHDHEWNFEGTLEKTMHSISMFDRAGPLDLSGFDGSGTDWMPQYKNPHFPFDRAIW